MNNIRNKYCKYCKEIYPWLVVTPSSIRLFAVVLYNSVWLLVEREWMYKVHWKSASCHYWTAMLIR